MGTAEDIAEAVEAHPGVTRVELIGSRARGTATELSDWDFHVTAEDFGEVAAALPGLVAPYEPLAAQWDPLGDAESYLLVLPGPVKVDLIFPDVPRSWNPPWRVGPDTLPAINAHFWDWTLWLVSKRHHGMTDRVRGELLKMSHHLLQPLGIEALPLSLEEAAERFVRARNRLETRYGSRISRRLEEEVLPLVRASDRDHYRPSGLRS
ncbi:nucleotidyltransferase domain-containing protein [Spirillospora sp. NPDC029432]|uniref:nucleotidyltransferase domain-containing protein n=1 Tax=Spirillospora sp. NPDC029432 TaxID=3154599 RepID=UPI003454CB1D